MMETRDPIERLRDYAAECCPEYEQYDSYMMRLADEIEALYMRLPIDADGVPIRVGDVVEFGGNRNKGIVKALNEHMVIVLHVDCDHANYAKYGLLWSADGCGHVQTGTVEAELAKFLTACGDYDPHHYDEQIAEFAERIRKVVEHG